MTRINFIRIEQPIGVMFLAKMSARQVAAIAASNTRKSYNDHSGIQRKLDKDRIASIAKFCQKKDAMFPTPIILSAPSEYFLINSSDNTIEIPCIGESDNKFCSIVDGQHRLEGIKASGEIDKFELLIAFIFDTDPSKDAYLFSIINGNQKPVSRSLIYDLYGLSKSRTVEKLCNKVMQALSGDVDSKLSGKIKMLGYKDEFTQDGIVSQATMIKNLMKLITDNSERDNIDIEFGNYLKDLDRKKYIFRESFIHRNDNFIIEENISFFNAWLDALSTIKNKYEQYDFKLFEKTIGFSVSYRVFRLLFLEKNDKSLSEYDFYMSKLQDMFDRFFTLKLDLETYSSSESGVTDLFVDLLAILKCCGIIKNVKFDDSVVSKKQLERVEERIEYFKTSGIQIWD